MSHASRCHSAGSAACSCRSGGEADSFFHTGIPRSAVRVDLLLQRRAYEHDHSLRLGQMQHSHHLVGQRVAAVVLHRIVEPHLSSLTLTKVYVQCDGGHGRNAAVHVQHDGSDGLLVSGVDGGGLR